MNPAVAAGHVSATANSPSSVGAADWLLVTLPGIIWGASFLFIAEGLKVIAPAGVTFVRILVGFATLTLIASARRPVAPSDRKRVALLGLLWMAFPLSMFPFAKQRVSSAITGMLNAAVPLFAAIVASVLARRLPSRGIGIGLAVGLTGAVLMAWPTIHQGRSSTDGVLLIFAALISYGFAINLARPLQQRNGALPALVLGVLVRHEHVAALSVLGAVVCVAGAWLMNHTTPRDS